MSLHDWDVSAEEAERIQSALAPRIRSASKRARGTEWTRVAGAAVFGQAAVVVVMDADGWRPVETGWAGLDADEVRQYRHGLMAFSYGPLLLQAFASIDAGADIAMFRAHGTAHPRRCGMAAHLGLLLDIPSIGCADRLLCGECEPPGPHRGDWTPVRDGEEVIGAAVRTREGSRHLFVSPGFALGVEQAVEIALRSTLDHRLPEPLRQARIAARIT
jgi:deoxyribonuclease V